MWWPPGPCAPHPSHEALALLWQAHRHLSRLPCSIPGRFTGTPWHQLLLPHPTNSLSALSGPPLMACPGRWLLWPRVWSPVGWDPGNSPDPLPSEGMLCAFLPALVPIPGVGAPHRVIHSPSLESIQDSGSLARSGSTTCSAALGVNGHYVLDLLLK